MQGKQPRHQAARERVSNQKQPIADGLNARSASWLGSTFGRDMLGLQRVIGNHAVARLVALGGRGAGSRLRGAAPTSAHLLVSRKVSPIIQRAKFSELMAFWKQQELGQAPTPQPQGKKTAQNLPPEPAAVPEDVKQDNPVLTEDKGPEQKSEARSMGHYNMAPRLSGFGDEEKGSVGHYNMAPRLSGFGDEEKGSVGHYNMAPRLSGFSGGGALSSPQALSSPVSATPTPTGSSPIASYQAPIPRGQVVGNKTQVKYLGTDEAREEFELKVGGSVMQGGQPYDTSAMYSKFKGDGFGIYVMSQDGRFYSTSHKIGLFHHSSFLGGGAVAGAGEMKVVGGTIEYITNKSGHYWPGDKELTQTLHALEGASGFSSAKLARLMPGGGVQDPYPDGAAGFLRDKPMVGGGGNKDAIKYDVKSMEDSNKGEDTSSLDLVRAILQHFVAQAQQGKLRKFNKANPEFGKTFEDLKLLVLAEFGWNEADTVTYQAVLENWNNDRPIGAVAGSQPPPLPTISSSPVWTPTPTDSSLALGAATPSIGADGRDYDAELAELLKSNPSPDWNALGLREESWGWSVGTPEGGSHTASAREKVLLLKGEKTIDEL